MLDQAVLEELSLGQNIYHCQIKLKLWGRDTILLQTSVAVVNSFVLFCSYLAELHQIQTSTYIFSP